MAQIYDFFRIVTILSQNKKMACVLIYKKFSKTRICIGVKTRVEYEIYLKFNKIRGVLIYRVGKTLDLDGHLSG